MSTENEETPIVKASWFNRIWSAFTGLIVGIASMFGITASQVSDIKTNVKTAKDSISAIKTAIEAKDYETAIKGLNDTLLKLSEIAGDVKESIEIAEDTAKQYVNEIKAVKAAIEAKDYKTAHNLSITFANNVKGNVDPTKLTGSTKVIYDTVSGLANDLNSADPQAKAEAMVNVCTKVIEIIEKTSKVQTVTTTTVETPTVETPTVSAPTEVK